MRLLQAAGDLQAVSGRLGRAWQGMAWESRLYTGMEAKAADAHRMMADLAGQAEMLSRYLLKKARDFAEADAAGVGDLRVGTEGIGRVQPWWGEQGAFSWLPALKEWLWLGSLLNPVVPLPVITGGLGWMLREFPEVFRPVPPEHPPTLDLPQPAVETPPVVPDPFWVSVGPAPVSGGQFTPQFQAWVEPLNGRIEAYWRNHPDDHAGHTGAVNLASIYRLTPEKVGKLWDFAKRNHVDPRLLLAILQQEGTGSFNTNPANSDHYRGHGPQPDWDRDLEAALDGPILAKLRLYPHAVEAGFPGNWVQWVNWYTPIDTPSFKGRPGVYAADIYWAAGVESHYREIVQALGSGQADPVKEYSDWMARNSDLFKPRYIEGEFAIKRGIPEGGTRPEMAVWHEYPRPHFPGTCGPVHGFWWFPAPDEYCWYIEKK